MEKKKVGIIVNRKRLSEKYSYLCILCLAITLIFVSCRGGSGGDSGPPPSAGYSLNFSTYFGGASIDQLRGIAVDSQGYIYVVGGTDSDDFPTTVGAYKRPPMCRTGSPIGGAGYLDAFVAKFTPTGQLVWSTLLGGCYYERAYGVKVDSLGYVYVHGRGFPDIVPTPGVFQTTCYAFQTYDGSGAYGPNNAWIVKLSPDGSSVVWQTCFATGGAIRDMALDENNDLYVATGYDPVWSPIRPDQQWPSWFTNSYRKTPYSGNDVIVAKIKGDGTQVYWASYIGGTGVEGDVPSIARGPDHSLYIMINTNSTDMPITSGAYQSSYGGGTHDVYVGRFSSDGASLIFGTYLGGSGEELNSTHNMTVDSSGNAYLAVWTSSSNFPTTVGAFQRTYGGGVSDMAVAKLAADGKSLIASTYLGTTGTSNIDGITLDSSNNVYLTGDTTATNFPVTTDGYQKTNAGAQDGVMFVLKSDFTSLLYGTYLGGPGNDMCRASTIDSSLNFICGGTTTATGYPTKNAYQGTYGGGTYDVIVTKFNYYK